MRRVVVQDLCPEGHVMRSLPAFDARAWRFECHQCSWEWVVWDEEEVDEILDSVGRVAAGEIADLRDANPKS